MSVPPFPTCTIEMLLFRPVCLEDKALEQVLSALTIEYSVSYSSLALL